MSLSQQQLSPRASGTKHAAASRFLDSDGDDDGFYSDDDDVPTLHPTFSRRSRSTRNNSDTNQKNTDGFNGSFDLFGLLEQTKQINSTTFLEDVDHTLLGNSVHLLHELQTLLNVYEQSGAVEPVLTQFQQKLQQQQQPSVSPHNQDSPSQRYNLNTWIDEDMGLGDIDVGGSEKKQPNTTKSKGAKTPSKVPKLFQPIPSVTNYPSYDQLNRFSSAMLRLKHKYSKSNNNKINPLHSTSTSFNTFNTSAPEHLIDLSTRLTPPHADRIKFTTKTLTSIYGILTAKHNGCNKENPTSDPNRISDSNPFGEIVRNAETMKGQQTSAIQAKKSEATERQTSSENQALIDDNAAVDDNVVIHVPPTVQQEEPSPGQSTPSNTTNASTNGTSTVVPLEFNPEMITVSQIEEDFDAILQQNIQAISQQLFHQSFTPLLTDLQKLWMPLLDYTGTSTTNSPAKSPTSQTLHTQSQSPVNSPIHTVSSTAPGSDFFSSTTVTVDQSHEDYFELTRNAIHTKPITAILELHLASFQTLLTFHSSHRENRMDQLKAVVSSWKKISQHLNDYHNQLIYVTTNQSANFTSLQSEVSLASKLLQDCNTIIQTNTQYLMQSIKHLMSNLDFLQNVERRYKIFSTHLLSSCPVSYSLLQHQFIHHPRKLTNDNVQDIEMHLHTISTHLQSSHSHSHSHSTKSSRSTDTKYNDFNPKDANKWTFFTIPIHLLQNIASYFTIEDVHSIQQINYPYYKLFSSSIVITPILLTFITNAQKIVMQKRIQQQRTESLFIQGTKCEMANLTSSEIEQLHVDRAQHEQQYQYQLQQMTANPADEGMFSSLFSTMTGMTATPASPGSVAQLQQQHQAKVAEFKATFLDLLFGLVKDKVLERITTAGHQRDDLRVQVQAIAPIVQFLVQQSDQTRIEHLKCQQQYMEMINKQLKHEEEKKLYLFNIQSLEQSHQLKKQTFVYSEQQQKTQLKSVEQRVQVLQDLQSTQHSHSGGNAIHTAATQGSLRVTNQQNGNNHNNNNGDRNQNETGFSAEEERMIAQLKGERKQLIKQVKSIRVQFDHVKTQTMQQHSAVLQAFNSKLVQEQQDRLTHLQHRAYQADPGKPLTSIDMPNLTLNIPTFEEFQEKSKQSKEGGQSFVWDIKQFITVSKDQPTVTVHDTPFRS